MDINISDTVVKVNKNQFRLISEIIKLSENQSWELAREEWNWIYLEESDDASTCLCGHKPIYNICTIKNKYNNNTTEVGNCCVKKFLKESTPDKIFKSVAKVRKDNLKSLTMEFIDYCRDNNIINDWELNFYTSIYSNKNLSEKQSKIKIAINLKCISNLNKRGV